MLCRSLACIVLFLPFDTLVAQDAALPPDLVRLVPADCVALVQVRSANELARHVQAVQVATGDDGWIFDAQLWLADAVGEPAARAKIDLDQPMAAAVTFGKGGAEPVPVYLLPSNDITGLVELLAPPSESLGYAVSGNYLAISRAPLPPRSEKVSRLLAGMPAGMVSARVDAAALIQRFRPILDMGLEQAEMALDSEAFEDTSLTMQAGIRYEPYLEFAREFLDSADLLDTTADVKQGEIVWDLAARNREGTPLAKRAVAEVVDWKGLAAAIDPRAPLRYLKAYDDSDVLGAELDFYGELLAQLEAEQGMAPELRQALRDLLVALKAMPSFGRLGAWSFDWARDGLRTTCVVEPPDPRGWSEACAKILGLPAWAVLGATIQGPSTVAIAGNQAQAWTMRVDVERFLENFGEEEDSTAEATAGVEKLFEAMLGKDGQRVLLWSRGARVGGVAGGDADWQTSAVHRISEGGPLDPLLARGIQRLRGANPGALWQLDFAAFLARLQEVLPPPLMEEIDLEAPDFALIRAELAGKPLMVTTHWGITGPVCHTSLAIDYDGLLGLLRGIERIRHIDAVAEAVEFSIEDLEEAVEEYRELHAGELPPSLGALTEKDESGSALREHLPTDFWGRPFLFEKREGDPPYRLWTLGADGKPGGTGIDLDRDNLRDER